MSDLIRREDALALRDKLADIIGALPMSSIHSALSEYRNAIRALPTVQPDAVIRAERDRCIRIVEQLQKEANERGWGDRDTQTRRIVSAIRHEIVGEDLPAVQPDAHVNETPKSEHDAANMLTPATKGGDA